FNCILFRPALGFGSTLPIQDRDRMRYLFPSNELKLPLLPTNSAEEPKVELLSERKEIAVPPKILAAYVGSYELSPGFVLVVTLENGQLMTQATGQPKFPIFAESETKFFLKVVDAQIEFFKNEKGEVTHLVLHQGGQDIKGLKK
ncbi:MAG TPA: DUF3471 domain-containing protein, partial [Terriglobia bacterium]|nr:DUF3471 domain-containing protein [Terriglobia bacterium]